MSDLSLAERIVALDRALDVVPHAFGGALALAYYAEPRATVDIDLNVFVGTDRFDDVAALLAALGADVSDAGLRDLVLRDGQARVMWESTPIDLFFAYDPFHHAAESSVRRVPFASTTIPVLGPEHLVVCKAVFNRPKDWVDIDSLLSAGTALDSAEVLRWVGRIAGDTDPRYDRIAAVLTR
ncbi:MAG: nucleotidyl transferase AbiEii/AbiGii toxin family protein [Acidimicrobiales bacterium]